MYAKCLRQGFASGIFLLSVNMMIANRGGDFDE